MNIFMKYGIMASQGGELIPQWTTEYLADALPQDSVPAWAELWTTGSASVGGGILNVTTITTQEQGWLIESGNIIANKVKRLEMFIRVNSNGGVTATPSHFMLMRDGVREASIYVTTDSIFLKNATATPTLIYSGGTDFFKDNYQTVRFEYDNVSGFKLYINGNLENTTAYGSLPTNANNYIIFGDIGAGSNEYTANTDYDYIKYQLDLVANPDQ